MVASEQSFGPSVGTMRGRTFDALPSTPEGELERKLARVKEHAREFARMPVRRKVELLRELSRRIEASAAEWVSAACRAKGIQAGTPTEGEEWIAGPGVTLRNVRLLARALEEIAAEGAPHLDRNAIRRLPNGEVAVTTAPYDTFDNVLYGGLSAETWLAEGIAPEQVKEHQASFYRKRDPDGAVCLVLGAGNVGSIPPMDVFYKLFVEGEVCILKMNPVNEYLGPIFERALKPLVDGGFLEIVYGGAEVGGFLCNHPAVDTIHITGSDKTHDLIVWGPPGPEREARKKNDDPVLKKPITSELGNVSPVLVVPGPYTDDEIDVMAENVAGMITNNASFNCNAAKMLVLPHGWPGRERMLRSLAAHLERVPARKAYYPGAFERFSALTEGHDDVRKVGRAGDDSLPWTLVCGLKANDSEEKNFYTEPFCAILSEVTIGSNDPARFLAEAVPFANDRIWGTLNSMLFLHPKTEGDPGLQSAVDAAVRDLRHGTVAVNVWPALAYAFCSTPWGGHPSATLADVQSGIGWVHNTVMLENIEKCVVRGPLKAFPKPAWFPSHKTLDRLGKKLVAFEASPSWLKVPSIAAAALRG